VREALQADLAVTDVFVRADDPGASDLRAECEASGATVLEVGDNVLKALADTASPQGVVAVAATPAFSLTDLSEDADLVLVLAQVRDPGNAGTLARSAAAVGADCVVFSAGSVDPFGPKTVRASAGAVLRVPVDRTQPLDESLGTLRTKGFTILGADGRAETSLYDLDLTSPTAIVMGNEAWGLDPTAVLDASASIPMEPGVESLNVATAGSLFLFEALRQRRLSSATHG
jgi:TrmH family RNA methyltransferase